MRGLIVAAWGMLLLAFALWGCFGVMVWSLYGARAEYALAESAAAEEALRGESTVRLRAMVHDTEVERAALESLLNVSILHTVKVIEETGRRAGAEVSIGEATPIASDTKNKLTTVSIVVNGQGSFVEMVRTMSLFETLTVPASLEQFEIEKVKDGWQGTARLRAILSSDAQ